MKVLSSLFCIMITFLSACQTSDSNLEIDPITPKNTSTQARVISVVATGTANNYVFNVGISSPDLGCNQYANWWEVITESGKLVYRRVLGHSHVNEQPFVRAGGTININANENVIIRAHMNTTGYGNKAFTGSVKNGFKAVVLKPNFMPQTAQLPPLPSGCAF